MEPFVPSINDEIAEIVELIAQDRLFGLERLKQLADFGDKNAISFLGMYLSEEIITMQEAVPWLEKASAFGDADAAWNLAMIARQGKLPNLVREWINISADLGGESAKRVIELQYDVDEYLRIDE